jgi:hypothetical protein
MNEKQRYLTLFGAILFLGTFMIVPRTYGEPPQLGWSFIFSEPTGLNRMHEVVKGYVTSYETLCLEWAILAVTYSILFLAFKNPKNRTKTALS